MPGDNDIKEQLLPRSEQKRPAREEKHPPEFKYNKLELGNNYSIEVKDEFLSQGISWDVMVIPLKLNVSRDEVYEAFDIIRWLSMSKKPTSPLTRKALLTATPLETKLEAKATLTFDVERYKAIREFFIKKLEVDDKAILNDGNHADALQKMCEYAYGCYSPDTLKKLQDFTEAHKIIITGLDEIPAPPSNITVPIVEPSTTLENPRSDNLLPAIVINMPAEDMAIHPPQFESENERWAFYRRITLSNIIINTTVLTAFIYGIPSHGTSVSHSVDIAIPTGNVTTAVVALASCCVYSSNRKWGCFANAISGYINSFSVIGIAGLNTYLGMSPTNAIATGWSIMTGLNLLPHVVKKLSECRQSRFFRRAPQPAVANQQQPLLDAQQAPRVEEKEGDVPIPPYIPRPSYTWT